MSTAPKNGGSKELKLAMLGMVDGNGHPWSWSALINGWDPAAMAHCPYPGIVTYLASHSHLAQDSIPGARVTHIWTDSGYDAGAVASAALIPHVLQRPEDAIGNVDAVIIATDRGWEHVERCRPFVEAGLPIFVDKPLCDNEGDLRTFVAWVGEGKAIMSSSGMRYAREFEALRGPGIGEPRFACVTAPKSWERYGIHALEAVYPVLGPGFISVRNTGDQERNILHLKHRDGVDVSVAVCGDMYGGMGVAQMCGTKGHRQVAFGDTYSAFRRQLEAMVLWLQTGVRPFPWEETVELMRLVIAGIRSREEMGREVFLSEIAAPETHAVAI